MLESEAADDMTAEVEEDNGSSADGRGSSASRTASRAGSGRLTVLESSIALIEQLTTACKHMEAACNAKDAQLSHVSKHLHSVAASIAQQTAAANSSSNNSAALFDGVMEEPFALRYSSSSSFLSALPSSTSSYFAHSDRSHTLRRGGVDFFSSSMCVAIIAPPGIIMHVNERFLDCSGWRRTDVLLTSFEKEDDAAYPLCPMAAAKPTAIQRRAAGMTDRMTRYMPQYPSSTEMVESMIRGERRKADCKWRCRLGDGSTVECDSTFWAVYDKPPPRAGQQPRTPDRMVFVFELDDAVLVEPADEE